MAESMREKILEEFESLDKLEITEVNKNQYSFL
jgi:hypothetical protein